MPFPVVTTQLSKGPPAGHFLVTEQESNQRSQLRGVRSGFLRQFAPSPKNPSLKSFFYEDIVRFKRDAGSNKGGKDFAHNNSLMNDFVHQSRIIAVVSKIQSLDAVQDSGCLSVI